MKKTGEIELIRLYRLLRPEQRVMVRELFKQLSRPRMVQVTHAPQGSTREDAITRLIEAAELAAAMLAGLAADLEAKGYAAEPLPTIVAALRVALAREQQTRPSLARAACHHAECQT